MAEPSRRIIVDGVEFSQVFQFPKIIGAAASALQPSRLIIALLMVVALVTAGRLWDSFTEPAVLPQGVGKERYYWWHDNAAHHEALENALYAFAPDRIPQGDPETRERLETGRVIDAVREGYLDRRADAATDSDRLTLDTMYAQVMQRIDQTRPRGDFEGTVAFVTASLRQIVWGVFALNGPAIIDGLRQLFVDLPSALWKSQTWFCVLYGLLVIIVLALGGGAISRIAAVQAAGRDRLRLGEAADFAISRWPSLIWAQLMPLLVIGFIAGVIMMLGLLMAVPVLDIIAALLYALALLLGLFAAFLLLGLFVGFPLLLPSIAVEGSDGADAMQRVYAYATNRPLHLLWYWLIGLIGLALGFTLVALLASLTLNMTASLFGYFTDNPAMETVGKYNFRELDYTGSAISAGAWHERWAAGIMTFWETIVASLVTAYVFSYFYSASTIAYLLMRRAVDGQSMDEIWRPGLVPGTLVPEKLDVQPAANEPAAPDAG